VTIDWVNPQHRKTQAKPRDKRRIFFRSLAPRLPGIADINERSDEDDEDLLDLLCSAQPRQDFGKGMHLAWARSDVRSAARLLPSSQSRGCDGKIAREDMKLLIKFLRSLVVEYRGSDVAEGGEEILMEGSVDDALALFLGEEEERGEGVDLDTFSKVSSELMVCFLLS
jgi:hypothetical protein